MAIRPKGAMGVHCWLLKAISENASLAAAAAGGGGAEKAIGTSGHKEALARSSALITSSSFDSTLSPDVFPPLSLWLLPFFLSLSTPLLSPAPCNSSCTLSLCTLIYNQRSLPPFLCSLIAFGESV